MACFTVVTLKEEIRGTKEEIVKALGLMGVEESKIYLSDSQVMANGLTFTQVGKGGPWRVSASMGAKFEETKFQNQLSRAKIYLEAERQGYPIVQDDDQANQIVIRAMIR